MFHQEIYPKRRMGSSQHHQVKSMRTYAHTPAHAGTHTRTLPTHSHTVDHTHSLSLSLSLSLSKTKIIIGINFQVKCAGKQTLVPNQLYWNATTSFRVGTFLPPGWQAPRVCGEERPPRPECSPLPSGEGHLCSQDTILNKCHSGFYIGQAILGHASCLLKAQVFAGFPRKLVWRHLNARQARAAGTCLDPHLTCENARGLA